jgi:signal transduction histidine kinase
VRHYVQSYQSIFPMVVTVDISEDVSRLDPEQELAAFRVVQESIQNASKHARASHVHVLIDATEEGGIRVEVSDDGRGFDPARVSAHAMGGSGLRGMEERATLLGARFSVDSMRGEGTMIALVLPPPKQQDMNVE